MSDKLRAYFYLHFCVFIWGFTAVLGKTISLPTLPLVWWRVALCCTTLVFILPKKQWAGLTRGGFFRLLAVGFLVGLHWLCFYGSIKIANASVAVASMAAISFFAALMEPLFLKQKIKGYELLLGLLILPGMALIAGNIDGTMRLGLAVGIFGALLAAIFSAWNKKILERDPAPPLVMSFGELFGALLVCSLALPFVWRIAPEQARLTPQGGDWLWMLVLAWLCTLLPYYLTLKAMRHLSAFATNLTINLEPVYGVLLAALLFEEHRDLSPRFYIGLLIILVAVFGHPFLKKYVEKNEPAASPVS